MLSACCPRCGAPLVGATGGICLLCAGRLALDSADLPEQTDAPKQGTRLGDYELLEEIGRGAMGVVYRARQLSLKRIVALKVVQSGQFASEGERKRFVAEAELAATLDHPNIVPMYDVGTAEGRPFCAMKFIEGRSLAAMLVEGFCSRRQCEAHRSPSKLLPGVRGCCVTAADLIAKVARAMHHAHQRGIIHRDLKPGNILVDAAGEPHVTDFGLARRLGTDSSLTLTGSPLGTPAYMSPEQARGEKTVTTAADIWSLGVLLYELLAGRPPFVAENVPALLRRIAEEEPTAPRRPKSDLQIDPELATICLKCLEKSPLRRYASAAELADDLDRWQRNEPILARRHTPWQRTLKWTARNPRLALVITLLLLSLLLGGGGVFLEWQRTNSRAEESRNRLLRVHVLNAAQRLDAGDPMSALPWLAAALGEEPIGSHRREIYRTALANIVRRTPLPDYIWWRPGRHQYSTLAPDGTRLLAFDHFTAGAWLFDLATGNGSNLTFPRVSAAAFSPDGTRFVIGGDGQALLYAIATREALTPPLHQAGWISQAGFSSDGRWVATLSRTSGVRLWNASSGELAAPEMAHPEVLSVAFCSDATRLATSGQDGFVRLWEIPSGRLLVTTNLSSPWRCVFSPDGQWLGVARRSDRDAVLLETRTLQRVGPVLKHGNYVEQVAFSPDSALVATGSDDGTARIWRLPRGEPASPPLALRSKCTALSFSPDGRTVATGGQDGGARVWDVQTGEPVTPWLRHAAAISGLAFTPEGKRLCTSSADGATRLWSLAVAANAGSVLQDRAELVWHARFSVDNRRVLVRGPRSARLYDPATGQPLTPPLEHGDKVDWASPSADGATLLTQCRDRRLRLWSLPAGELLRTWDLRDDVVDVDWLAGTNRFVSLTWKGELNVWSTTAEAPVRRFADERFEGRRLAVSPDGRWFAAAFDHFKFGLWSDDRHEPIAFGNCPDQVCAIRFSPDSAWLATGDEKGRVQFRRTRDGVPVGRVVQHGETILHLVFSPDGRSLASVSADGFVRLSAVPGGEPAGETLRPPPGALRVEWSADGQRLLVLGEMIAQVWDAVMGTPLTPPLKYDPEIAGAAFANEGRELIVVTEDARLWREAINAPDWPDADWQFLARTLSSQHVDASGSAVPWFGLADTNTLADAEALTTRWLQLRPRLRELLHGTTTRN